MNMKYILITILCAIGRTLGAQDAGALSIDSCYSLAERNYPVSRQRGLVAMSTQYSVENAGKAWYPQLSVNGQATYQSDVTQVPIKLPNINIPTISKDQYKLYGELSEMIYDGGATSLQKQVLQAGSAVELQKTETELYALRERVNQLFFGVLLIREQRKQADILNKDIALGINKASAAQANGIALKTSVDVLKAEQLKLGQRIIELQSAESAYLAMLGQFVNRKLDTSTRIISPAAPAPSSETKRPELLLYNSQIQLLGLQDRLLASRTMPRLGLFVQGGYGRPALNMLDNTFNFYYIGGVRLSWSVSNFYTRKNEKSLLNLNYQLVESRRETFLFNTNMSIVQTDAEISKLEALISSDEEIIALRNNISEASLAQFENGVINSSDYLREINAADQARQNKALHQVQLLMAQYQRKTTSGN